MRAELAGLTVLADRRRFAVGCLAAILWPGQLLRLAVYVAVVAAAVVAKSVSQVSGPVRVEVVLLAVAAPLVIWRVGNRAGRLSIVGAGRAARYGRGSCLVLMAAGVVVAAGFLSGVVPREHAPVVVVAVAALGVVLSGYCWLAFAMTAAGYAAGTRTLLATGGSGAAAGAAWCALMPFNTSADPDALGRVRPRHAGAPGNRDP